MANYVGINGVSRPISGGYVGVNDVARKLIKGYVGVNGVAKSIWQQEQFYWLELPLTIHQSDGRSDGYSIFSSTNPDEYKTSTILFFNGMIQYTANGKVDTSRMTKVTLSYNDATQLDQYEWWYSPSHEAVGRVAEYRKTTEKQSETGEIKKYHIVVSSGYNTLYFVQAVENGGFNIITSNNKEQFPDGGCVGEKYYVRYYPDEPDCFSGSISVNVTEVDNAVFKFIQTEPNGVIITTSDGYTYSSAGTGLVTIYVPKTVPKTITLQRVKGLFIPCSTVSSSTQTRKYYAGCIRGSYSGSAADNVQNLYSNLIISGKFKTLYTDSLLIPLKWSLNNSIETDLKVYAETKNINKNSVQLSKTSNGENFFYYDDSDAIDTFYPKIDRGTNKEAYSYICYTDNSFIRNRLESFVDQYTTVTVKHLDGRDW